jgi:hypothetical protein
MNRDTNFLDWPVLALRWVCKQIKKLFGLNNSHPVVVPTQNQESYPNFIGESSVEVTWLRYANDGVSLELMKKFFRENYFFEPLGVRFYGVSIFADSSRSEGFASNSNVELVTVDFTFFVESRTESVPSIVKTRKEWASLIIQRIHDQIYAETPWEEGRIRYNHYRL